jgi:hypothetical protein
MLIVDCEFGFVRCGEVLRLFSKAVTRSSSTQKTLVFVMVRLLLYIPPTPTFTASAAYSPARFVHITVNSHSPHSSRSVATTPHATFTLPQCPRTVAVAAATLPFHIWLPRKPQPQYHFLRKCLPLTACAKHRLLRDSIYSREICDRSGHHITLTSLSLCRLCKFRNL